jgi:hypothetical protein
MTNFVVHWLKDVESAVFAKGMEALAPGGWHQCGQAAAVITLRFVFVFSSIVSPLAPVYVSIAQSGRV